MLDIDARKRPVEVNDAPDSTEHNNKKAKADDGDAVSSSSDAVNAAPPSDSTTSSSAADEPIKVRRGKLQKYALLLSYCGSNYFGLQRCSCCATNHAV